VGQARDEPRQIAKEKSDKTPPGVIRLFSFFLHCVFWMFIRPGKGHPFLTGISL
jgi:hypothetical protein